VNSTFAALSAFHVDLIHHQTGIGDWVVLGTSSQCHDAGATQPVGVESIAKITSINGGAGTNATVDLGLPDVTSNTSKTALADGSKKKIRDLMHAKEYRWEQWLWWTQPRLSSKLGAGMKAGCHDMNTFEDYPLKMIEETFASLRGEVRVRY
jgi:hypothetical protein